MRKSTLAILVVIITMIIALSLIFHPMKVSDLAPDAFDDVASARVTVQLGMVDTIYELIEKDQIECVSMFLKEIIARKQVQMLVPESHMMHPGEDYLIELFHVDGSVDVVALYSGNIKINDIVYPVSSPKTFVLLRSMLGVFSTEH